MDDTKPTLVVHHLQVSQSERIPWLCEELGVSYTLVKHKRAPYFSPQSILDLHPMGQAPVICDGSDIVLAESAACVEYIINVHGNGKLTLPPTSKTYADYLYWFHFANGTLQPQVLTLLYLTRIDPAGATTIRQLQRLDKLLTMMNSHLGSNSWLAGGDFTCADIMTVFSLTTMRVFYPLDLSPYPNILMYLKRIVARQGYQRARAKADPDLEVMINGQAPLSFAERLKSTSN